MSAGASNSIVRQSAASGDVFDSLIARLADEYLQRLDRGESPDVEQYVARWPGDARILRQTFASLRLTRLSSLPAVAAMAPGSAEGDRQLGDFRLLGELGRGGMGVVYEAEQVSLGRRVALKILPFAGVLDSRQLQRFKNEALAAAQLNHANIVDVIAVGCERGVHFYAMRLIDGPTLAEVIAELSLAGGAVDSADRGGTPVGPSSEDKATTGQGDKENVATGARNPKSRTQNPKSTFPGLSTDSPREYYRCAARITAEIAMAVDHAHQSGIVHRDVKPSNILLDARGKPWITDFGLARLETSGELTLTGDLLGTLRYMSPEQAAGDRRLIDHRTDVYSLGATLYELLTLRPAFDAEQREKLLRRIALELPHPPRKLANALPVELETIVLKALEKNPADRYATAGKLADDLQRFLDHRPIQARRSRVAAHAKSLWRRHQMLFVAVLTTLLVASSVAGLFVWRQWQEAVIQRGLVLAREADLRQRLYAADLRAAHQAWQRGDVARAQEMLDRYASTANDDLRDFAWHYLWSLLSARPAPLTVLRPGHGNIYCVQFSPQGKHLAAACGDGHVELWNAADWSLRFSLAAHRADADCVAFSPDGGLLASGGEDGWLRLWNVETGELIRSIDAHQKDTLTVAISPDGRTLAAGGIDGIVRFWQLPEGAPDGEYRATTGRVQHLAFSPDGHKLATAGGDSNAMIVDVATHARLCTLPSQAIAAYAVAFSAHGDALALGSGTGLVVLANPTTGRAESLLGGRAAQLRAVAFSPTAPRLASAGASGVVDLWDTAGRTLCARFYGHDQRIWSLAFSPDGKQIASAGNDGSVHIWNADAESGVVHAQNAEPIYEVKFAADGKSLVTPTDGQELVAWDGATLDRLSAQPLPGRLPPAIAFAPDRRAYAAYSGEGEVWLGSTMGGAPAPFNPVRKGLVDKMALAGDARLLVWYTDGALEAWNTAAERLLDRRHIRPTGSWPAAVSLDGRLVAATRSSYDERLNELLFYKPEAMAARIVTMAYMTDFYAVALSPANRWLAVSRSDGPIEFFETATGERAFTLSGHQSSADALVFSSDGRTLASADRGGAIRLWHLATREELFVIRQIDAGGLPHIDFSPDGRRLVVATGDRESHGHIYVWPDSPAGP